MTSKVLEDENEAVAGNDDADEVLWHASDAKSIDFEGPHQELMLVMAFAAVIVAAVVVRDSKTKRHLKYYGQFRGRRQK